jgi:hypothetical protein
MSTVLWANMLLTSGKVTSDESDKWALFEYAEQLDEIAGRAHVGAFTSLFDRTDVQYNMSDDDLPAGVKSTTELMARSGVWVSAADAIAIMDALLVAITSQQLQFGSKRTHGELVVAELSESLQVAKKALELGAKFNFSIVL